MYPHRIHLRGPWTLVAPVLSPPKGHLVLPGPWTDTPLAGMNGDLRLRRRFSWLARLEPSERLWVTLERVPGLVAVCLNGVGLQPSRDPDGLLELDITDRVEHRNELELVVRLPVTGDKPWGDVALEVRCRAYLRGVRMRIERAANLARLQVSGAVIGTAERPLELYALLDGANVLYATVEAAPEGRPFSFISEPLTLPISGVHQGRVELVHGAVVWWAEEHPVDTLAASPGP